MVVKGVKITPRQFFFGNYRFFFCKITISGSASIQVPHPPHGGGCLLCLSFYYIQLSAPKFCQLAKNNVRDGQIWLFRPRLLPPYRPAGGGEGLKWPILCIWLENRLWKVSPSSKRCDIVKVSPRHPTHLHPPLRGGLGAVRYFFGQKCSPPSVSHILLSTPIGGGGLLWLMSFTAKTVRTFRKKYNARIG